VSFVIVVEASLALANYAAETLIQAGYESRGADAQNEAIALTQERRTDLVLTDYYLAQGDGLGLISALKELAPKTAVALVTGLGDETLAQAALTQGAMDYVIKGPDYYEELPKVVQSLMERAQKEKAQINRDEQKSRLLAQMELANWLDHNFKNILSAALGSLALIDFKNPDQPLDKRLEYLNDSQDSLKSALKLLESLTAMATVVDEADESSQRSVLVAAVVDEAWERVLEAARKAGRPLAAVLEKVTFQNNSRWLPPQKVADQDLLTILEALLINALEAVTQTLDPLIAVNLETQDRSLSFTVRDNGRGMDEKVQKHAFDPLFSTKGEVGVGLSLTTVRALVVRHFGEISLSSAPGQGTTVTFTYNVSL
jgi:signal transduction histidine kinase